MMSIVETYKIYAIVSMLILKFQKKDNRCYQFL